MCDGFERDGDFVVVDRSLKPSHGDVVVAAIDGENCVKRFCQEGRRVWLESANQEYAPVIIHPESELKMRAW